MILPDDVIDTCVVKMCAGGSEHPLPETPSNARSLAKLAPFTNDPVTAHQAGSVGRHRGGEVCVRPRRADASAHCGPTRSGSWRPVVDRELGCLVDVIRRQ